jgi:hypothetical protein
MRRSNETQGHVDSYESHPDLSKIIGIAVELDKLCRRRSSF